VTFLASSCISSPYPSSEVGVGKNGLPAGVASRIGTLIAELRDALIEGKSIIPMVERYV
jgi:hypothetical protein